MLYNINFISLAINLSLISNLFALNFICRSYKLNYMIIFEFFENNCELAILTNNRSYYLILKFL